MKYFEELKKSMSFLSKDKKIIFIGQAVEYPGTAMFNTLNQISKKKRYELPVTEELQMGATLGLALAGYVPVSIYPRWNFLILGLNQLVNHIDKFQMMTKEKKMPKIIIRTSIGSERPLHPQHQHVGDFTEPLKKMCNNINFIKLNNPKDIFKSYSNALCSDDGVTVLIEYGDYYNEK